MPRPPPRRRQRAQPMSPNKPGMRSSSPRVKQNNQSLAHKPLGKRLTDSDDSDELVVKGQGRMRGRGAKTVDVYASGALGNDDKPNSHPTRAQRRRQLEDAKTNGTQSSKSPAASISGLQKTTPAERPSSQQRPTSPLHAPAVQAPQPSSSAKPTPMREESILNGIKPRKRQNSILMEPALDESTMGSFALPEDENSPLHLPKQKQALSTPLSHPPSSGSRKRKLGPDDVPTSPSESRMESADSPQLPLLEPQHSAQPISALRASGQKQRRKTHEQDETDIMAPPMSSSSELSSPPKPAPVASKRSKTKSKAPPVTLTTKELQTHLMPSKRQKALRARNKASEFDIPTDSPEDGGPAPGEDDSTFLAPGKRRATKAARRQTSATAKSTKASRRKAPDKTKNKESTTPAPLLASSRSRSTHSEDPAAKSPSQLSAVSVASPPQRTRTRTATAGRGRSTGGRAQDGGSPLKQSFADPPDKENQDEEGEGSGNDDDDDDDDDNRYKLPSPAKQYGGKWADIDDFEMDFEDVVVGDVSSDPLAR